MKTISISFKVSLKMRVFFVFVLFSLNVPSHVMAALADEFPGVMDSRNFKESSGGKGIPKQGRILERSIKTLTLGQVQQTRPGQGEPDWNYVVSVNCARGGRSPADVVKNMAEGLLPEDQRHRLGIVIGINEKVGVDQPLDYSPDWDTLLGGHEGRELLQSYGVPILLVYYQWTAFREHKDDKKLSASEVRQRMFQGLDRLARRQKDVALARIRKEDAEYGFPFGGARTQMLNGAQDFIAKFSRGRWKTYVHVQDSDFVSFNEELQFSPVAAAQGKTPKTLFQKYDDLVLQHKANHGCLPIIAGGAHTYSPGEDMTDYLRAKGLGGRDSAVAKQWTRFTSEMGNLIKHLIGVQSPAGLYFHEPNTLVLSPTSAAQLMDTERSKERKGVLANLAKGFAFGIASEMQDFTRALFKECSLQTCRAGMVFSATTVLSTSMKRGSDKPFLIACSGTFDALSGQFFAIDSADLSHSRNMPQEVIQPSDWMSAVATGFAKHRVRDARTLIVKLFQNFDPIGILINEGVRRFRDVVVGYEKMLTGNAQAIRQVVANLSVLYDKQKKGAEMARQMLSAAWECGQAMRLMLLDYVNPAQLGDVKLQNVATRVRDFLAGRMHRCDQGENPFVLELLGNEPIVRAVPKAKVDIAVPIYSKEGATNLVTALKLLVDQGTLTKEQVLEWTGYGPGHVTRNFDTLCAGRSKKVKDNWIALYAAAVKAGVKAGVKP